jgi:hypothetical protein
MVGDVAGGPTLLRGFMSGKMGRRWRSRTSLQRDGSSRPTWSGDGGGKGIEGMKGIVRAHR